MRNILQNYRLIRSRKVSLFLLLNVMFIKVTFAQDVVSGTVTTSDGIGLPGVTVLEQGTSNGVITDIEGKFTLTPKSNATLVISYIGFQTQSIVLNGRTSLDVTLLEDLAELDEVVVIGYGTQKKSHLTGAISKVTNENLEQLPFARVDDALVGQVSGVQISAFSEEGVGSDPNILVRGVGSVSAGTGPLLVIDGAPVDSEFFGNIDMNDVESFEVLKDAASASIFGSRGANGVIMITTKSGVEGPVKFSYNGFTGIQDGYKSDYYDVSIGDHIAFELANNEGVSDATRIKQLLGQTDWEDIYIDGGTINSHALSARGGSKKTKYTTSLSYLHDEGVLLTDDFKKANFRAKINTQVSNKFSLGFNINPSYTRRRRMTDALRQMMRQDAPWLPERHTARTLQFVNTDDFPDLEVGDYAWQRHFNDVTYRDVFLNQDGSIGGFNEFNSGSLSNTDNAGPLQRILEREQIDKRFQVYSNINAKYEFSDELNVTTNFTATFQDLLRNLYRGTESTDNPNNALARELNQSRTRLVENLFLNYTKTFVNHEISAVLGISAEQEVDRVTEFEGLGFSNDRVPLIEASPSITVRNGYTRERRLLSFIGRVNYAYLDRYLVSVSLRRDGSSVFGQNNKFGTFPSLSVGWRISEENFLAGSPFLSNLKLRASIGVTGNDNIALQNNVQEFYPSLAILQGEPVAIEGEALQTFNPINIPNPDLKWERSIEINPGIDFGLFDNRISGSIEYYQRTSDDLLLNVALPSPNGLDQALVNQGEVRNEGVEVNFRTYNLNRRKIKWSTNFIASTNKNTLREFEGDVGPKTGVDGTGRDTQWLISIGNPISNFYGFVYDGEVPLEFIARPFEVINSKARQVYVKDLNGDGVINGDDRTILGDPYPEFIWSITNEFTIGRFDVSFMFQGSHGAETRNIADLEGFSLTQGANAVDFTTAPRADFLQDRVQTSDIIQDASFVALRNFNVGYTLPPKILEKLALSSARVYLSGSNLLFFDADNFTGWNPESIRQDGAEFTPLTYGYNRGGTPIVRKVVLGINVNF